MVGWIVAACVIAGIVAAYATLRYLNRQEQQLRTDVQGLAQDVMTLAMAVKLLADKQEETPSE